MKKIRTTLTLVLISFLVLPLTFVAAKSDDTATQTDEITFILGKGGEGFIESLDPVAYRYTSEYDVIAMVCEPLFTEKVLGEGMSGILGTSYTYVNSTTLEIHLREGVTFQDGTPFNATAAKWNIDRFFALSIDYGFFGLYLLQDKTLFNETIDLSWIPDDVWYVAVYNHTEIVDDYTVRIHQNIPYDISSTLQFQFQISPTAHADFQYVPLRDDNVGQVNWTVNEDPYIGTGAYKLEDFDVQNGETTFVKYSDYWGGEPYIDKIVFKYYQSVETMQSDLVSQEIDACEILDPTTVESQDFLTIVDGGISIYSEYVVMYDTIPLEVRKAFNYAFNYAYYIDEVNNGLATRSGGALFKGVQYQNDEVGPPGFNLTIARQAMVDSGLTSGTDVSTWNTDDWLAKADSTEPFANYTLAYYTGAEDLALEMRETGRQIGIKITLNFYEQGAYDNAVFVPNRTLTQDMHVSGIGASINDPVPWLSLVYKSGGFFNDIFFPEGNAELDELIDEFILSDPSDTERRAEIADAIQNKINNELYQCVWTIAPKTLYAYNNYWENVDLYANDFYNIRPKSSGSNEEETLGIPGYIPALMLLALIPTSLIIIAKKRKMDEF
ncbi:MAG: ABC transporter substrate-binding protein [Promethearchaeota archaeon]